MARIYRRRDRARRIQQILRYQQQMQLYGPVVRGKMSSSLELFGVSDRQFKLTYRFSKANVMKITRILMPFLVRENEKGNPLSPPNQVAVALLQLSGACFQRITGMAAGGLSQTCARLTTKRVVEALFAIQDSWIRFPSPAEMDETAEEMFDQFKVPNIFAGVDGCQIRFQKKLRGCPPRQDLQLYWCRKQFYSLNVQFVSNHKYIYSVDAQWYGSAHDARIWKRSVAKVMVEASTSGHIIAGDSAYPLSTSLIKPFANPTRTQKIFNGALSGVRTRLTENVYGRLKARFPILREMRHDLVYSQRIVVACAVLHNMAEFFMDKVDDVTAQDPFGRRVDEPPQRRPRRLQPNVDNGPALTGRRDRQRLRDGERLRMAYLRDFAVRRNLPFP